MLAKKLAVIALFTLVSIGLFAIGQSFVNQLACEGQPINFRLDPTDEQQIWGDRVLSQEFVAPRHGLNRIDILFQTYQRQNTYDVNLSLLEMSPDVNDLLQGVQIVDFTFNAADVRDRVWRTFTFSSIPDSAGKTYVIRIQSPESVAGDAITVGGIEWDAYAPGSVFLGPVPVRADIAFRSCYQMTTFEKLQVLSQQITQNRPAVWGNAAFYILSLVLYVLLLVGFFWKLAKLVL